LDWFNAMSGQRRMVTLLFKALAEKGGKVTNRLRRTAYHEAGHTIASLELGVPIKHVTIVPDASTWGHLLHLPPRITNRQLYSLPPFVRDRLERRIVVSLAGREGERLVTGRYDHRGAAGDYQFALNLVTQLVGSSEEATAYFRWLEVRARQLIRAEHRRPQIDALAAALLEHHEIDSRAAIAIMYQTMVKELRAKAAAQPKDGAAETTAPTSTQMKA
jgi:hypothetical protein